MQHKPEVYVAIRHPFTLAWREFLTGRGEELRSDEAFYRRHREAIADEVVKYARAPSPGSRRFIREYAMKPWQMPRFTKDDGVQDMSVGEIKRICLGWLNANFAEE